jgi:hypothetical protein
MPHRRTILALLLAVGLAGTAVSGKIVLEVRPSEPLERVAVDAVLDLPRGTPPPSVVFFRLADGIFGWATEADEVPCQVIDGRLTDCRLPIGTFDVRVRVPGLAPRFFFGEPFRGPGPVDLGTIVLDRPGRLVVRPRGDDGPLDPRSATLRVTPDWFEPSAGCFVTDILGTREEVTLGPGSDLIVEGLAAGRYQVETHAPGHCEDRRIVEVVAGEVAEVDIVLAAATPLDFAIDPPNDPGGEPWRIWLTETKIEDSDWGVLSYDGELVEAGVWRSTPLAPGTYHAQVISSEGGLFHTMVVEHRPDRPRVEIEVPLVFVDGRITHGDLPVAADLTFSRDGEPSWIDSESDASGAFSVVLPAMGVWRVAVISEDPDLESNLRTTVTPTGSRNGQMEIVVPESRLSLRLVDPDGRPVPGNNLYVEGEESRTYGVQTDAEGLGELRGLPGGRYRVDGSVRIGGEPMAIDPTWVELSEDEPLEVTVRLRPTTELSGRVVAAGRAPVAGARVVATAAGSGVRYDVVTDRGGWFQLAVDAKETYGIVVLGPGDRTVVLGTRPRTDLLVVLEETDDEESVDPSAEQSQIP